MRKDAARIYLAQQIAEYGNAAELPTDKSIDQRLYKLAYKMLLRRPRESRKKWAKRALRRFKPERVYAIDLDKIVQQAVCRVHGVEWEAIRSAGRLGIYVDARTQAAAIMMTMYGWERPDTMDWLGRHRTTGYHYERLHEHWFASHTPRAMRYQKHWTELMNELRRY